MFEDLTLFQLLQKGGYVMILLGGFSILSIGVMLERAWSFSRFGRSMVDFPAEFIRTFNDGGVDVASGLCDGHTSPLANVFKAGLAKIKQGAAEMAESMELSARREIADLERYLGVLGTIGNTAPFVGLFGTVLGIIRAFHDLAGAEGAGPSVVADGIAEALVATAAGLFVAIPAVIAYNYFTRRVARCSLDLEVQSKEIITALTLQGDE
ncbi:MAG: MotA/TolQ/ExbB proton channel family protein [Deltaproteobacteria bacterium]|nr:MotA/TolQ/ExbB proton channel family protein [Deltaproteobacteria bacterium]